MLSDLQPQLNKALEHLKSEYSKLQAGRAKPELVEDILVPVYGSSMPVKNVATVSVMDQRTLTIIPFDRSTGADICRGIAGANIGLNPQDRGDSILINIPMMTEENRRNLQKIARDMAEDAKVSVRSIRAEFHKNIQKAKTDKTESEDILKTYEDELQEAIDGANKHIDEISKAKEEEVMKV
ncbi:ribosome recycling factor [Candidatus Peribacteria bacterium]|nr:ribosome recycling factor [Candidatus Peribacteria bacterium]